MLYGIELSANRPSETNRNFKKSYLKSILFVKLFTIFQLCNQNNIGLKYFADIRFDMFHGQKYIDQDKEILIA